MWRCHKGTTEGAGIEVSQRMPVLPSHHSHELVAVSGGAGVAAGHKHTLSERNTGTERAGQGGWIPSALPCLPLITSTQRKPQCIGHVLHFCFPCKLVTSLLPCPTQNCAEKEILRYMVRGIKQWTVEQSSICLLTFLITQFCSRYALYTESTPETLKLLEKKKKPTRGYLCWYRRRQIFLREDPERNNHKGKIEKLEIVKILTSQKKTLYERVHKHNTV